MRPIIYLIPGQGADSRLFKNLTLNFEYEKHYIKYELPEKGSTMRDYAIQLSNQIDRSRKIILIGCSLGGMLANEMIEFLDPEKVIIIGSAKSRKELPIRYRLQKYFPLYQLISGTIAKKGALILQPIFEPDRDKEEEIFVSMLKDKDPLFLKRTIHMIINWDRENYDERIVHIHGDKDNTIPIKNVNYDYKIKGGSHVMTLTRGEELSELINQLLEE